MGPVIKVNGVEIKDALCIVDGLSNVVTLEKLNSEELKIDVDKVYVEVNIYGKLPE